MSFLGALLVLGLQLVCYAYLVYASPCTALGWEWASNSVGQSPCTVVELLDESCSRVGSLTRATPSCQLGNVLYSLMQACKACQDEPLQSWSDYSMASGLVPVVQNPEHIQNIQIPNWAYQDVMDSDMFNATTAFLEAAVPTTLTHGYTPSPSKRSPIIPPVSDDDGLDLHSLNSTSSDLSATALLSQDSNLSRSDRISAIVAGVLGAVILLAALAIYYLHKTRRHRRGVVCIRRSSVSRLTVLPTSPVYDICRPIALEPLSFDGSEKFSKVVSKAVLDSVDGASMFRGGFRDSRSLYCPTPRVSHPPLPSFSPSDFPISPPPAYRSVYIQDSRRFLSVPSF